VRAQNLIAAAAALAGRTQANEADLWPLIYVVPTAEQQASARDTLSDILKHAQHPLLGHATEQAAQQPLSRVPRLAGMGAQLDYHNRLAVAAWLQEVDANFGAEYLPEELAPLRAKAAAVLASDNDQT
jgi:MoxR-like ATPase